MWIKPKSRLELIFSSTIVILFNIYLYKTGNWIILTSTHFALLPLVVYNSIVLILAVKRFKELGQWIKFNFLIICFLPLIAISSRPFFKIIFHTEPIGISLSFPLRSGSYYIINGGVLDSQNYHRVRSGDLKDHQMDYALDIVKVDPLSGNNTFSDDSKGTSNHRIFGDTLFSPSNGIVFRAKDDETDHEEQYPNLDFDLKGNYIVIRQGQTLIMCGHIKKNSVLVKEGDYVAAGQPIALIGHNGTSNLPHLHLHCYIPSNNEASSVNQPVPMYFSNSFISKGKRVSPKGL